MVQVPTIDPSDEVIVRDSDGSWKVLINGQMVAIPAKSSSAPTPASVVTAVPASPVAVRRPAPVMPSTSGRPMVADVLPPRVAVVGPVQELRMNLDDYLRMASTPADRAAKVLAKIKELEAQDYSKRLEGIAAWKTSDVYSLYILLGQESVLSNTAIEETIAQRKAANQPFLSVEDFQAITEVNNKLRT